jgi:hypothetical protein
MMIEWLAGPPVEIHRPEIDKIETAFNGPLLQRFKLP